MSANLHNESAVAPPNGGSQAADTSMLSDISELRRRARNSLQDGAVTPGYGADKETVLRLLNEALATELLCILRYRYHYFVASGLQAESIKDEFLQHAQEEQQHADQLAERIVQLGGDPNFNPEGIAARSHAEFGGTGDRSLSELIRDDLIAERVAIESYREMVAYIGGKDPTTRRLLESILAVEEEHAEEFASMLSTVETARQ